MTPFRSTTPDASPCTKCGAARADLLDASGNLVCRGCSVTGEANARLAAGRRSGKLGAIVGLLFGSGMILASLIFGAAMFGGSRGELRLSARIFAILLFGGVVIVATCIRNLRRLAR